MKAIDIPYLLVILVALPWAAWRSLSGGRPVAAPWRRFTGGIAPLPPKRDHPRIWLHGVSVGEVSLLHGLAESLLQLDPGLDCVVSSSTTTGLELAARRFGQERVFPCPLDVSWAVTRVLDAVAPDLIVLGELELWPNLLAIAHARAIPIAVANGRMSERSFRGYSRFLSLARSMLAKLTIVLARSEEDASRFRSLGAPDVAVTGSMKFDGVEGDRTSPAVRGLADLAGLGDDPVFIAGSTQPPEEHLALEAFRETSKDHPRLRLLIVPRHVERADAIAAWLDTTGVRWQRRSRLGATAPDPAARVLLVDTTGELGRWWGTAAIAFVGGSLDGHRGGQNMLEPAAYGAAVCFGPHTRNFREEVGMLLAAEAAEVVRDGAALTAFLRRCLEDPAHAAALGRRSRALVEANRGARETTAARLAALVRNPHHLARQRDPPIP